MRKCVAANNCVENLQRSCMPNARCTECIRPCMFSSDGRHGPEDTQKTLMGPTDVIVTMPKFMGMCLAQCRKICRKFTACLKKKCTVCAGLHIYTALGIYFYNSLFFADIAHAQLPECLFGNCGLDVDVSCHEPNACDNCLESCMDNSRTCAEQTCKGSCFDENGSTAIHSDACFSCVKTCDNITL